MVSLILFETQLNQKEPYHYIETLFKNLFVLSYMYFADGFL